MSRRRVVVTGLGLVTPVGNTVTVTVPAGMLAARVVNTDECVLPETSAPTCFAPKSVSSRRAILRSSSLVTETVSRTLPPTHRDVTATEAATAGSTSNDAVDSEASRMSNPRYSAVTVCVPSARSAGIVADASPSSR